MAENALNPLLEVDRSVAADASAASVLENCVMVDDAALTLLALV